jgi:hypothetical protein
MSLQYNKIQPPACTNTSTEFMANFKLLTAITVPFIMVFYRYVLVITAFIPTKYITVSGLHSQT